MASKPIALPNVTPDTVTQQAYRLFGAVIEVQRATEVLAEVRRAVSEKGVDPTILASVFKEASADPWERAERDRTLATYITALRVPTMRMEAGFGDLLAEEAPEETDDEKTARQTDEGFWACVMHKDGSSCPYQGDDDALWCWSNGWNAAARAIGL